MTRYLEADLDALQRLINTLQIDNHDLEYFDGTLRAAYYPFLAHFQSVHRPQVEELFDTLDQSIVHAAKLEQDLLYSLQLVLSALQKEEGEPDRI